MTIRISRRALLAATLAVGLLTLAEARGQEGLDPLPSWNDGKVKQSIIDFVAGVTKPGGPDYVRPAERIATFDNDGTARLFARQ